MIVMKFGGTSLGSGERIAEVANLVKSQKDKTIVVVSAMGGITNKLVDISEKVVDLPASVVEKEVDLFHREMLYHHRTAAIIAVTDKKILADTLEQTITLLNELKMALLGVGYLEDLSDKSRDYILSFGERLSILIVSGALSSVGLKSIPLTGYEAGIITDSNNGRARPLFKELEKSIPAAMKPILDKKITPVVAGFIAGDAQGKITTLGRGGSDYTASLLGSYLKSKEVQIWTDVDGILSTDPRIVPGAKLISTLSYVEAMDLAYFGAKVIHSKMIEPAMVANIPVLVKNTFSPDGPGSKIVREQKKSDSVVKAVAVAKDIVIINIQGVGMAETPNIAGRVFYSLGSNNINVLMISGSSESNLSFVIEKTNLEKALDLLASELGEDSVRGVGVLDDVSIVTIVGAGMRGAKGLAAKVFNTVAGAGVNIIMIAQGSSEVNIAFIVLDEDVKKAVTTLHEEFIG